ncbi:COG3650 family protein [Halomonas daqiaonensis]|uniref:Membrane-bound lysozyme-inhibitor of c-type lysozyme n=1 Tax=Halomonas daqiaonensis TaxID=650850 RepID=A0A1H7RGB2_9GAMM|nr:MliC family protein [Halomonas daqiaonensis]SEL59380.1 Membrane-bound lysozyme-inhibitor of c-type lysozyme [Halomonas daqiaonensis]
MSRHTPSVARSLVMLGAVLLLTGCATTPDGVSTRPEVADRGASRDDGAPETRPVAPLMPSLFFPGDAEAFTAWRCTPAQDLITATTEEELRLWSAHGAYRLPPAVVASGTRYQQGELSFWHKGDEAVVESATGRLDCNRDLSQDVLTRRQRPGTMFHARGNEPGWVVNLGSDRPEVSLLLDYGERELTLPYRVTTLDNDEGRMILASGRADTPFELRLEARACFDSMSGQPFPARVTLTIDGEQYRGCGQGIAPATQTDD